jgi:hypothetical protein
VGEPGEAPVGRPAVQEGVEGEGAWMHGPDLTAMGGTWQTRTPERTSSGDLLRTEP